MMAHDGRAARTKLSTRFIALAFFVIMFGLVAYVRLHSGLPSARVAATSGARACAGVQAAFEERRSGVWSTLVATVIRLLPDEQGKFVHQRFIVRCSNRQSVLIVNDVSVGTRAAVNVGDRVTVRGQYVWNALGGLVHFTHHNPEGGIGGWILVRGRLYA